MSSINSVEVAKTNFKKVVIEPIVRFVSDIFTPPEPRLVGTCITHNPGNVQVHTPVEIIKDPVSGERYCNCPAARKCIQSARVIANAKIPKY